MPVAPSGAQFEIAHGEQRATIVEVGGGVRRYDVGARPVLEPYPLDTMCDGGHGAVLAPWPNRLADGRYRFDGIDHQLPLSEPDRHNAIHGLLRWRPWQAVAHTTPRVVMAATLHPMSGYPFRLLVEVAYELDDDGLTVTTTATNGGADDCPYACGHHPYLSPGSGSINSATVQLDARTRITTDSDRQLPTGVEPVAGTPFDLTQEAAIGDRRLDDAYTDLERDADGRAWVRLTGNDGRRVELWADATHPVLQVFTGDTLRPSRARGALAAEPMTAPANALQTGEHLVRLAPGQAHTSRWGVRLA